MRMIIKEMAKKSLKVKKPVSTGKKQLPKEAEKYKWQPGVCPNPKGRPKGSRTVFAETFLKDFLRDWEEHGADAIEAVRRDDPTNYVKIGASLLPKDFNINNSNEAEIDKILDQFDTEDIKAILAAIALASGKDDAANKFLAKEIASRPAGAQSNSLH